MADPKSVFRSLIADAVNEIIKEKAIEAEAVSPEKIVVQDSPDPEMGDLGSPMFVFAKSLRLAPPAIAQEVAAKIGKKASSMGTVLAVGSYLNIKLDKAGASGDIVSKDETQGTE